MTKVKHSGIRHSSFVISPMFLGYNTNGLAHHDLFDAVELLAEIGYRGVAITIDHNALPPYGNHTSQRIARLRRLLERLDMRSVIETAPDSCSIRESKHEPTLLSADRRRRIDFYKYAVDCAPNCGATACRSGRACCASRLLTSRPWIGWWKGLREVLEYAAATRKS